MPRMSDERLKMYRAMGIDGAGLDNRQAGYVLSHIDALEAEPWIDVGIEQRIGGQSSHVWLCPKDVREYVENLRAELRAKDAEIDALKAELVQANHTVDWLSSALDDVDRLVVTTGCNVDAGRACHQCRLDGIKAKDAEIGRLRRSMAVMDPWAGEPESEYSDNDGEPVGEPETGNPKPTCSMTQRPVECEECKALDAENGRLRAIVEKLRRGIVGALRHDLDAGGWGGPAAQEILRRVLKENATMDSAAMQPGPQQPHDPAVLECPKCGFRFHAQRIAGRQAVIEAARKTRDLQKGYLAARKLKQPSGQLLAESILAEMALDRLLDPSEPAHER